MPSIDQFGSSSKNGVCSIARTSAIEATCARATAPRRGASDQTLAMLTPSCPSAVLETFDSRANRPPLVDYLRSVTRRATCRLPHDSRALGAAVPGTILPVAAD